MTSENRMNEALRQLGEEHRLGMIKTEEFRGRRRAILESWGDRDATTSPGKRDSATTQTNPSISVRSVTAVAPASRQSLWVLGFIVMALGLGGAAWYLMRSSPSGMSSTGAPTVSARSAKLLAVMRDATALRSRNRWETEDTDRFLAQWRSLSPADQKRAQQEPSLQSLRYELVQNIRAERQANDVNPSPEGNERLDRLNAFLRELAEDGS